MKWKYHSGLHHSVGLLVLGQTRPRLSEAVETVVGRIEAAGETRGEDVRGPEDGRHLREFSDFVNLYMGDLVTKIAKSDHFVT